MRFIHEKNWKFVEKWELKRHREKMRALEACDRRGELSDRNMLAHEYQYMCDHCMGRGRYVEAREWIRKSIAIHLAMRDSGLLKDEGELSYDDMLLGLVQEYQAGRLQGT